MPNGTSKAAHAIAVAKARPEVAKILAGALTELDALAIIDALKEMDAEELPSETLDIIAVELAKMTLSAKVKKILGWVKKELGALRADPARAAAVAKDKAPTFMWQRGAKVESTDNARDSLRKIAGSLRVLS